MAISTCGIRRSRLNMTFIDWTSALLFNLDRLWVELISLMQLGVKEKRIYYSYCIFLLQSELWLPFWGPHAVSKLFLYVVTCFSVLCYLCHESKLKIWLLWVREMNCMFKIKDWNSARCSKATTLLKFDSRLFKILIYYLLFTRLD